MKIKEIKPCISNINGRNYVFVKVITDEGIHGTGEAYSVGPDLATVEVINDFGEWLAGEDPSNIEYLWAKMYNFSRFPGGSVINAAISGIELALWDIAGKAAGMPVYKLLGGSTRKRILVYGKPDSGSLEKTVEKAHKMISEYGYSAIKVSVLNSDFEKLPFNRALRYVEAKMEKLRKELGDELEIGVDVHARVFEPVRTLEIAEVLKPYRPYFIEEPIRPENIQQMARVAEKIGSPLATGECLYTKYQFNDLIKCNAADIIQPDICLAGGLLEMRKISAIAEANYIKVAPHNPLSPLSTIINAHFAATIPNFLILEHQLDDMLPRSSILSEISQVKDGYIDLPERPGWGVELNEDFLAKHPYKRWHRDFNTLPDGSAAFV